MPHTRATKTPDVCQKSNDEDNAPNDPETTKNELAVMLSAAMEKQHFFTESQFPSLNGKQNEIKSDLASCTKDIQKLCADCNDLRKRLVLAEKSTKQNKKLTCRVSKWYLLTLRIDLKDLIISLTCFCFSVMPSCPRKKCYLYLEVVFHFYLLGIYTLFIMEWAVSLVVVACFLSVRCLWFLGGWYGE